MNNWKETTLGEVSEKIAMGPFGSNIKVETFVDDGVPVISGQHLRETRLTDKGYNYVTEDHANRLKNSLVFRGDVIFTHAGNIGQVSYIPEDSKFEKYIISQRQFYLRCNKEKLDPRFITYFFKSRLGQHKLLANANQVGVPSIAQPSSYLKSLSVNLPSLEEQKQIAAILSSLDDKVELLRKENETLEKIAQTIFKEWFVNFNLPAEVLTKEGIDGKKLKLENGIPEGWRIGKYSDVVDVVTGKGIKKENLKNNGLYRVVGANGEIGKADEYLFDENLILTGRVGTLGTVYISSGKTWISDNVLISKAKAKENFYFAYFNLKSFNFESLNRGSTQPLVTQTDLKNVEVVIPTQGVLKEWHNIVSKIFDKIDLNNSQIQTLSRLRDTLLPKLMSGELKIDLKK